MRTSTAHVAFVLAACAVSFGAIACTDRGSAGPHRAAAVSFHTDAGGALYGAVDAAPLDLTALTALARTEPTPEQWHEVFTVRAGDSTGLPMLGAYKVLGETLRFTPRFPPVAGTTYFARYNSAGLAARSGHPLPPADATGIWQLAAPSGPATTRVEAVFPSSDSVPMNLLRMYIQFSAPMSVGDDADKHVRLLDESGHVVPAAFLVAAGEQELWDSEHRRLTVFFDPGRIKRDLTPHDQLGLPLVQGHSYRFVIDSAWHDARGLPLVRGFEKRMHVGAIDRGLVRTATWKLTETRAGSKEPLTITFAEPLDRALLQRMLVVKRTDGTVIRGAVDVVDHETRWSFTPNAPWVIGEYYVDVDAELEDLAGNNLHRLFDVMPGDTASRGVETKFVRVPFTVRMR